MSNYSATYQGRLTQSAVLDAFLSEYANHYNHVERSLYADMRRTRKAAASFKNSYLLKYEITARQFNAIRINLDGKIDSVLELLTLRKQDLESQINKAKKVILKIRNESKKHQKKRRLEILETKLAAVEQQITDQDPRICFGSRQLFNKQFNLEINGYLSHEEWKRDWDAKRNSQFYVLGSGDETNGCQGCVISKNPDGTFNFKLRSLSMAANYAEINNVAIKYGHEVLNQAIQRHEDLNAAYSDASKRMRKALKIGPCVPSEDVPAGGIKKPLGPSLSYRFLKDEKGWRVFITTDMPEIKKASIRDAGKIGVDINADCLAVTEIDRFGNLVDSEVIHLVTYGKNANQAEAIIGDAVKIAVDLAIKACKPIVIEKLKFSKKRAELEGENSKYARMLSSFAYNKIVQSIKSRTHRFGVEVIEVNPAYTSVIGLVNYSKRLGISAHQAAAFAIARRGSGFRERPIQEKETTIPTPKGDHVTFPLPVRNRGKHVWSFWSDVKKYTTAVLAAHIRPPEGDPAKSMKLKPSKRKCPVFTVRSRDVNRLQNCAAGAMGDDIPW